MTNYFTDLGTLRDELLNFKPLPCCSCGKYICGVDDKVNNFQHQDFVMHFLNGLNESYSQVRIQILMMEPIPSIDKFFRELIFFNHYHYCQTSTDGRGTNRWPSKAFQVAKDGKGL